MRESALRAGALAQEHGDLKTAIADFRRALALKPDSIEARANLGAALAAAGELDAAIEEDSHVLELSPQNDAVRMNLAMAYYRTGNWNQARVEFEQPSCHASFRSEYGNSAWIYVEQAESFCGSGGAVSLPWRGVMKTTINSNTFTPMR